MLGNNKNNQKLLFGREEMKVMFSTNENNQNEENVIYPNYLKIEEGRFNFVWVVSSG